MTDLSDNNQVDVIEAIKSSSRYLDDILNNYNPYSEGMVNQTYPPELKLNKANTLDTEPTFLDLHLLISNGLFIINTMALIFASVPYLCILFTFDIKNFIFSDGHVSRRPSYGVYISQLIRFARVCSYVAEFKGTPVSKALTCMKIYLYKQKWQFCQTDQYFWLFCCMSNLHILHRLIHVPTCSFRVLSTMLISHFWLLPGFIPFASPWHAG